MYRNGAPYGNLLPVIEVRILSYVFVQRLDIITAKEWLNFKKQLFL